MSQTKAQLLDGKSATIQFTGGSASAPAVSFTGDPNTGIYSPGADQVAISTNGTGRLFVDASGRVLVGTATSPTQINGSSAPLVVQGQIGSSTIGAMVSLQRGSVPTASNQGLGNIAFGDSTGSSYSQISGQSDGIPSTGSYPGNLVFYTTPTGSSGLLERLRITSAGLVGIGTSSPLRTLTAGGTTGELCLLGTGANGVENALIGRISSQVRTFGASISNSSFASIEFRTTGSPWYEKGAIAFRTVSGDGTTEEGVERMRITSTGVGIGTTSPVGSLDVRGSIFGLATDNASNRSVVVGNADLVSSGRYLSIGWTHANSAAEYYTQGAFPHVFITNGTERARIDSSGRLLVGTSTARTTSTVSWLSQIEGAGGLAGLGITTNHNTSGGAYLSLAKSRGTSVGSNTIVQNGDGLGYILFSGADGTDANTQAAYIGCEVDGTPGVNDMPGRLVFSTTADGASSPTERMRISSSGTISAAGAFQTDTQFGFYNTAGGPADTQAFRSDLSGNSTTAFTGWRCYSNNTATRYCAVFHNPNGVVGSISTNASATAYTTSSDYRLKENVTAVTDGITRLQQLKPSRFNFIADPAKTVDGFIAHEVQAIVPEAITGEKDAVDDEGNPQYQGIDQSKLVPLLTAALQEAVAKIETLQGMVAVNNITIDEQQHQISALAARLTALESA